MVHFGRYAAAVVTSDAVLEYERRPIRADWSANEIEAQVRVTNAALEPLEILGASSPCPDCMEFNGVPATVPPLATRIVTIHVPVKQFPTGKEMPLDFKFLFDREIPASSFQLIVIREAPPEQGGDPTPARLVGGREDSQSQDSSRSSE